MVEYAESEKHGVNGVLRRVICLCVFMGIDTECIVGKARSTA